MPDGSRGHFERVQAVSGRLAIAGFLFHTRHPVDVFRIEIDQERVASLAPARREDVGAQFAFIKHAVASGFAFGVDLPNPYESKQMFDVRVTAEGAGRVVAEMRTWFAPGVRFAVPPAHLLEREVGYAQADYLEASAMQTFRDIWEAVSRWKDPSSIRSVLDWGCGVGRMLVPLKLLTTIPRVIGSDVDPEAVGWSTEHIPGAEVFVNEPSPPLALGDDEVDLVTINSVLTHLQRDMQLAWLAEIARVLAPGGLCVASTHGELAASFLHAIRPPSPGWLSEGFADDIVDSALDGVVTSGYYRATFQSRAYTLREFSRILDVVEYIDGGWLKLQDLVVMRKRA